jgi:4-oxalocrotonate tautomerase
MPIVHAHILQGRRPEQIDAFAKAVTKAAEEHLGVPSAAVRVLIHEIEPSSWFTAGERKGPPR